MLKLHNLSRQVKPRKRVGRGGKLGGTSGRGHKGQNARSGGGVIPGFEGGQMPLARRLPKRGFTNARFKKEVTILSLKVVDKHFADGAEVTKAALVEKGLIPKKAVVKLLGGIELTKKFRIVVDAISASAKDAVQKAGGEVSSVKES